MTSYASVSNRLDNTCLLLFAGLANLEYVKAQLGVPPLSEHASEEDEPAILHHPEEVDLDRPASTITASDFTLIRDGAFPWYR
jgi:hypothetical protein